jgi:integrase/recombinase XerD
MIPAPPAIVEARPILPQAETDAQVLAMWLHGRPFSTRAAYEKDWAAFKRFLGGSRPIRWVKLIDLQAWIDHMTGQGLKPRTVGRRVAAVKSLLSFAQKIGYVAFNPGAVVKAPKPPAGLTPRMVEVSEVAEMAASLTRRRDKLLVRFLFATGARVAEAVGVTWADTWTRPDGHQAVQLLGKGHKARIVIVKASLWKDIAALRGDAPDSGAIFTSQKGQGPLSTCAARRIVKKAATRAGIERVITPHALRHGHATAALSAGAALTVVSASLGHADLKTTSLYLHAVAGEGSGLYVSI